MKYYLLTGADGNLGGKLTKKIVDESDHGVIAVSSFPERIPVMFDREHIINIDKIMVMSSEEMFAADLNRMNIEGVVHFAFSRAVFPNKDIADSLDYSLKAFKKMADSEIQNCIYISSQSVYGDTPGIRTEDTPPAPNSIYAMAKYAGEKLFEASYSDHSGLQHSILRLDNVIQSQNLVKALCKTAKSGETLQLTGGKQQFSYIDQSEVADAVLALLSYSGDWKQIYNVGPHAMQATLIDIAETVKRIAKKNGMETDIDISPSDKMIWAGMDTSSFAEDTGWRPGMSLEEMIGSIYEEI